MLTTDKPATDYYHTHHLFSLVSEQLIQLYVTQDHDVTTNTFQKYWLLAVHCTALPADVREVTVPPENWNLWHRDFLLCFEEALSTSSLWLSRHNPTMISPLLARSSYLAL